MIEPYSLYIQSYDVGTIFADDDSTCPTQRCLYYGGCYSSRVAAEVEKKKRQEERIDKYDKEQSDE